MKKRLRKKMRVGEFTELGFELKAQLEGSGADAFDGFVDRLVQLVEGEDLAVGGGGTPPHFSAFVTRPRGSVTEDQRERVRAVLAATSGVTSVSVGPLVDAWYGWR